MVRQHPSGWPRAAAALPRGNGQGSARPVPSGDATDTGTNFTAAGEGKSKLWNFFYEFFKVF